MGIIGFVIAPGEPGRGRIVSEVTIANKTKIPGALPRRFKRGCLPGDFDRSNRALYVLVWPSRESCRMHNSFPINHLRELRVARRLNRPACIARVRGQRRKSQHIPEAEAPSFARHGWRVSRPAGLSRLDRRDTVVEIQSQCWASQQWHTHVDCNRPRLQGR